MLKPSDITPLSALRLAEIARTPPPGVLSVVTGNGPEAASALVRHPFVRLIGFIGSDRVGGIIQRDAAEVGVKEISLELGGKNALIVCPDADLDAAAAGIVNGMNFAWSEGQSCGSTSRVLLHASVAEQVLGMGDRAGRRDSGGVAGRPLHADGAIRRHVPSTTSPAATSTWPSLRGCIGARGWASGGLRAGLLPGADDLHRGTARNADRAGGQVFGPVMSVITYADLDEAITIANGVDYGLTASIWTRDVSTALLLADRVEAGYVWVNGSSRHFWGMPSSGVPVLRDRPGGEHRGTAQLHRAAQGGERLV